LMITLRVVDPRLAETVTGVVLVAMPAVIVNVAIAAPAGTVTRSGTESSVEVSERSTVRPPAGAAPVRFTVPVPDRPLTIVVGLAVTESTLGGLTVRFAALLTPGPSAVITTDVLALTGTVETVNVALDAPAGIVTLDGTVAADRLLDDSAISRTSPVTAPSRRTVAVDVFPPTSDDGDSVSDETSAARAAGGAQEIIDAMSVSRSARCFICFVP
jgi:hypothetical protein